MIPNYFLLLSSPRWTHLIIWRNFRVRLRTISEHQSSSSFNDYFSSLLYKDFLLILTVLPDLAICTHLGYFSNHLATNILLWLIFGLSNKCSWWANQSIYLIFFNNYCHQAPVRVGLGLIDIASGLCKLNTGEDCVPLKWALSVRCKIWSRRRMYKLSYLDLVLILVPGCLNS